MAKARMLHNKISKSLQVDSLSLPAQLLFTWMIPWGDDEGRMKGEPKYIKGTVIPYKNWSEKLVKDYLNKMKEVGLIYYWGQNNEWFIEFIAWDEYQQIRKDRFVPSKLPSFRLMNDNHLSTTRQPTDKQQTPQANVIKDNPIEVNKSEYKEVADNNSFKSVGEIVNPNSFVPQSEVEAAALEVWKKLEPNNPLAFQTTYLKAARNGLPANLFYIFASEIKQNPNIEKRGAIFNIKVNEYLARRSK